MGRYISEYSVPECDLNNPLNVIYAQLKSMQDLKDRNIFETVVFDTEVARPPTFDEMPCCKILHTNMALDSESYPMTLTSGSSPLSLYVWFRAQDEDKEKLQQIRNNYIYWILSKLQGTVSGVTDATGITPDGSWEFEFAEGTKVNITHATPFDNLGWPFPTTHPDYCTRIDLAINVYPDPSPDPD